MYDSFFVKLLVWTLFKALWKWSVHIFSDKPSSNPNVIYLLKRFLVLSNDEKQTTILNSVNVYSRGKKEALKLLYQEIVAEICNRYQ